MNVVDLYPSWKQAVVDFIKEEFKAGDMVTFAWLYEHFKITIVEPETPYREFKTIKLDFLKAFKYFENVLLIEHQIALKSQIGIGYVVVAAKEQSNWAFGEGTNDLRRALKKMGKRLINVDHAQLTSSERRENADKLARLSMLAGMNRRIERQLIAEQKEESA